MNTKRFLTHLRYLIIAGILLKALPNYGQTPFLRTGQVYVILQNINELQDYKVQPGYNSINTTTIGALPSGGFDAIGFRRSDNFLYGIATANNHLYKVGQNALAQDLGPIGLNSTLFYLAGDVSPDGQYFWSVGSDAMGIDVHLAKTDLTAPGFPTQLIPISGVGHLADIAFDPTDGTLFGFDQTFTQLVRINASTGFATPLQVLQPGNSLYGVYFDAFGDMYGVGYTLFGVVDGFFRMNKITGAETRLATGPSSALSDVASCPFSVEMKNEVSPGINLPCTDLFYTYTLVNGSEETFQGLEFLHAFPPGYTYGGVQQNSFGGLVDAISVPGTLKMQGINLTPGSRTLKVKMVVGDIPKGKYNSQATVNNLPPLYGSSCLSDYPNEPGFEDSTAFIVNRFDKDTLDFAWLICEGNNLLLETADYGNSVLWNNGSTVNSLTVDKTGLYSFAAGNTCEKVVVEHNVTSATCPFTIAVAHVFEPDTSFACSDLIFRFIISNDSGEPRLNLGIADTLPSNFSFVEVVSNPFGGTVVPSLPNVFCLHGMTLKEGIDTLDVKIHVDDVPPGNYKNRAVLFGLPVLMGPIRLSDYPFTLPVDSSVLHIQGALYDTLTLESVICANEEITLDVSSYGKSFLWDDGSTEGKKVVDEPGIYHLVLYDGCEPADVFWEVIAGPIIQVEPIDPYQIHQGETVELNPQIVNLGDSLQIQWFGALLNALSCIDCPSPLAKPLESTEYGLRVENELCSDSVTIVFEVDQSRRIYAPNVFSPNEDGENDEFYLQSPDFGQVKSFNVYDRWGNLLFQARNSTLDDKAMRWDGRYQNKALPPGVYMWWASIEFVDGRKEVFSGSITIVQ